MNNSISNMVKELENENKQLRLLNKQYEATSKLLYCCMKNKWAEKMIEDSNIDFGISDNCSKKEIQDYISYIKKYEDRITLNNILDKLDDLDEKAFVLNNFIKK